MKAKLIKTEVNYILEDDKGVVIASTSLNKEGLSLSLKNCQAIECGYDLDEVVEDIVKTIVPNDRGEDIWYGTSMAVGKQCFQKALELMSNKKFSEEDVISMIEKSRETGLTAQFLMLTKQQTEWDVEVEMVPALSNNGNVYYGDIPKTDEDGCLILKKI